MPRSTSVVRRATRASARVASMSEMPSNAIGHPRLRVPPSLARPDRLSADTAMGVPLGAMTIVWISGSPSWLERIRAA